jgi:glycosyltransferase involved in cell wall biosynthesis
MDRGERHVRVLIVSQYFWPESFRVNDLALGLRERGHDVEVLTALPNYPRGRYFDGYSLRGPYREQYQGVPVHRVPIVPRGAGQAWRLALNYASFALSAAAASVVRRGRWDAVLVFQVSPVTAIAPALLSGLFGANVVTWIQDLWPETLESTGILRSPAALRAAGSLSRLLYRRCDRLLVQSRAYVPPLRRMGIPEDRLDYVPNWAEALYESPPLAVPRDVPWSGRFSIMFAGNLGRVQALETVLAAADRLRDVADCHWVFVGDGVMRPWIESEIRRRGLGAVVHLVGPRASNEMPALYASADAMLVSLRREEILAMTVPSKVQSYLAAGRPIVASLDGEGARIVEDSGAGWASPADDADGLAALVRRMRDAGPVAREHMGQCGRAYYRDHFSRSVCIDRIERALRDEPPASAIGSAGA